VAENVGSIYYDVTLDTARLITARRDVEQKLDGIGAAGDKLQSRFTAIAGAISAALSAIAVDGLVSKVVAAQRQFDVMFSSLKTVTGGVDKASAAWERLTQFASKTPYTLEQSVNGFVKLKALGLDPSERAMTSFGNTASAMGKDLTQMIEAVADASTGEFERLKEFGIKAKTQGDEVSFTFQGVTTTVKNSASDITEYLTKIGEVQFAGAMSERMKTLDGDISNLEDSWNALFLAISQSGAGDIAGKVVRAATTAIQEMTTSIKDGGLTEYFSALKALIPTVEVVVMSLAGVMTSRLIGAMASIVVQAGFTAAAMVTMTSATTAFNVAIGALGGPVGIAITAIGLLALNWDKLGNKAKTAADIIEDSASRIAAAQSKTAEGASADLAKQMADAEAGVKRLKEARMRELTGLPDMGTSSTVADIDARIKAYEKVINDIKNAQAGLARRGTDSLLMSGGSRGGAGSDGYGQTESNNAKIGKWMEKYATDAEKVTIEIAKAKKELGDSFTPDLEQRIRATFAKKTAKKDTVDDSGYLASLRKDQASEINVINETEDEKLRIAKKNLDEKLISQATYNEAVTLIVQTAEDDRQALMSKTQQEIDKQRAENLNKTKQEWEEKKRGEKALSDYIMSLNRAVDPLAALEMEYQGKLQIVTQYEQLMAQAGVDAHEQAELAKTQITQTYEQQKLALAEQTFRSQNAAQAYLIDSLNALGSTASSAIMGLIEHTMTAQEVMRSLGRTVVNEAVSSLVQFGMQQVKNAVLSNTIAASKGAVYAASVSAQVTGMSAMAAQNAFAATAAIPIVGPALAPAAAAAAATAASALGAPAIATAPVAGARQYGGSVSAGSLYRVNETGAPEMYTASNGNQYMLASSSGNVTAADKVGSSVPNITVVVENHGSPATVTSQSYDPTTATVRVVVQEVANQISNNTGAVWSALRSSTNVQGKL
jgi:hypothetical protein